ncbi:mRNA cleavage and polyadenylation factor subunit [Cryomyces antarcticus]|uniref:mRNA cleavage and polyadenylation factor subunit n=1 Tax=Cryomyces antarcticus TaxID=329879 RepID=A0ABR0LJP1_9PEZI|nr:mRNA cleavage and polyadenylation factor subunit [Cryomyces antarcticus]
MWKGIWFGGYSEDEPYKLTMLGKGRARMEVVAAEFLPWGDQLYIIVADAHGDLHVLQFDPEPTPLTRTPNPQIPNLSPASVSSTRPPSTPDTP